MRLLFSVLLVAGFSTAQAAQITNTTFAFPGRVEIHVQPQLSELDVLFVVDDSGSMSEHQKNLIANIPALTKAVLKNGVHVHAGVTTTSNDCSYTKICRGQFFGNPKVADSKQGDFLSLLATNLNVGTNGSATEQPLEAAVAALSEPVLSQDHPDFLRSNAHLAIVLLTDADDQSDKQTPESFASFVKALKPNPGQATVASIQVLPGDKNCKTSEEQGTRLDTAIKLVNGKMISLCAQDFGAQLGQLGSGIVGQVTQEIPLTTTPDASSIVVTFGSTTLVAGDMHYGWVYDSVKNAVILGDKIDWSSMSGDELIVSFVPKDWK
ncbi:vWA domain-containing protein [Bdellovibrio sp. HCB-110]|uniref:vWA domain-containing protein n=1 Tax=Bdellovibrio sp. HCB-110 TaxID=3391182 RepID=UPI0039B5673D